MRKLLNTKEASEITGYSIWHIRALAREGKLKHVRVGSHSQIRFLREDIMNLTQAPGLYPEYPAPGNMKRLLEEGAAEWAALSPEEKAAWRNRAKEKPKKG